MKICVSTTGNDLEAVLDPRFGRCPYLIIVDSETMQFEVVSNTATGSTGGAGIQTAQTVANKGVKVVITGNIGPNASEALLTAGIEIVKRTSGTVREVVEKYKNDHLQKTCPTTAGMHAEMGEMNKRRGLERTEDEKMPKRLSEEELKLMAESGYTKKAIDLYLNNVNLGTLKNPSVVTTFCGRCGDIIKLYLQIDNKNRIEKASFYCLGCPGAVTSASAMTILLKGMTIMQAKNMTEKDILKELDGLPKSKTDCATLSIKTLQKAIAEYEKQKGSSG